MRAVNNAALDFARDDREACMAVDASTGAIVVAWAVNQTLGTDYDLFFVRSSDGGTTWSTPAALNSNASTDTASDQFPSIAAGGGTLVAVWESTSGAGTDFDIRFTRSADGGQTWSAVAPLNTNAATDANNDHDRNARIATDGDGTWICVWDSNDPSGGTTGFDQDVFFSKSTDDAVNWSAPALVDAAGGTDSTFDSLPRIGSDGEDGWVAVWADALTNGMQVMWSDSDGDSWTLAPGIVDPGSNAYSVAGAPDGTWLIASRKLVGDSDVFIYQSADGGMTWSAPIRPVPNDLVNPNDDENPWVGINSEGMAVVAWRSDEQHGGGLGFDPEIVMCASTDSGLTWGPPTSINGGVLDDEFADEEPVVASLGNGDWLVAWKSTNPLNGTIGTDYDVLVAKAQTLTNADCNGNSISDGCEIIASPSVDQNNNGVPDSCQPQFIPEASLTELLRTGDPGPVGGSFGIDFGMPQCKGNTDSVLFWCPSIPNDVGEGFLLYEGENGSVLVADGDAAPGVPADLTFATNTSTFDLYEFNAQQQVVFEAELAGPGVTFDTRVGVWIAGPKGVTFVLRGGDTPPGFPPGFMFVTSDGVTSPRLNDAGEVVLRADLVGPGITSANNNSLWRFQGNTLQMIMREGDPAPGAGFNFPSSTTYDIDNRGTIYFQANGIWSVAAGSISPVAVALPGQQAPGLDTGVTLGSVGLGLVAPDGTLVVRVTLAGAGVNTTNDLSLWTWKNGVATLIAREGDAATSPGTGLEWSLFSPAAVSANGRVVFAARAVGSAGTDEALWIVTPMGLRTILRTGTPGTGTFPPTFFDEPTTANLRVAVNDGGDVIVGSEAGIYGWRENYGLFYVASGGASAVIDGQPQPLVSAYFPSRFSSVSAAPNHSWNFANNRSLVFRVSYPASPISLTAMIKGTLPKLADLTGDTCVDVNDLLRVITQWGPCVSTPCTGDGTHDGVVDVNDLLLVITNWGCDGGS